MLGGLLFLLIACLLLVWVYYAWSSWRNTTHLTPEEQAYDDRVAALNDRQANRLSDDQIARPVSNDDAWALMVRRGRRAYQESRERRAARRRR